MYTIDTEIYENWKKAYDTGRYGDFVTFEEWSQGKRPDNFSHVYIFYNADVERELEEMVEYINWNGNC